MVSGRHILYQRLAFHAAVAQLPIFPWTSRPDFNEGYVALKPFTLPAGLASGVSILVPKGVPRPDGYPRGAIIYDFNKLDCQGGLCGDR